MSFLVDKNPLIVVGDSARARLFCVDANKECLVEVESLVNPAAHQHSRDLQTDRAGRGLDRNAAGGHAFAPSTDVKEHSSAVFAREVAHHVEHASNGCHTIVLIAAPKFLGMLRKQLAEPIKSKVSRELNKDLTTTSVSQIEAIVTTELRGF